MYSSKTPFWSHIKPQKSCSGETTHGAMSRDSLHTSSLQMQDYMCKGQEDTKFYECLGAGEIMFDEVFRELWPNLTQT